MNKIRVYHLEDYAIMRDGIRLLLAGDDSIELVGEAQNGEIFFKTMGTVPIDILLLDIYLDGMNHLHATDGFDICKKVKKLAPGIKVLAHSVYDDADRVAKIMKAGANGFVSKKANYQELIKGIKAVHAGQKFICQETSKRLKNIHRFLAGIEETLENTDEFFSKRERDVLALLAKGYSTRDIATKLFITEKTVESHRKNLVLKARVKNTVELIAYASLRGFIKK